MKTLILLPAIDALLPGTAQAQTAPAQPTHAPGKASGKAIGQKFRTKSKLDNGPALPIN